MHLLDMSRFSMGSFHYMRYPFTLFLNTAVKLGFENVELWAAAPHLDIDTMNSSDWKVVERELSLRGLKPVCITPEQCTYPINVAAYETPLRFRSIRYFKKAIDIAIFLKSSYVLVTAGCGYFNQPVGEAWKRSIDSIAEIAEYARSNGIKLLYETLTPYSSNIVNTPQQLTKMIKALPENVSGVVDIGQIAFMKQNLEDYITLLGDKLAHVHLHDFGQSIHMALGDGILPIKDYITKLERNGYKGFYSFECNDLRYRQNPQYADEQNVQWLRTHEILK